uniref:Methyltransferase domain-containing protein n=1 Tax=Mucochytrium quahogii TaxID=96639 RepID=A0A7S2WHF1_9STRA|mmetsp:Transcript_22026/g.35426  ORF Transcript_22026/g.35426 Transcript_22026/m.35426 type:complete len:414 (-) Transcript_22026:963-2204(-)
MDAYFFRRCVNPMGRWRRFWTDSFYSPSMYMYFDGKLKSEKELEELLFRDLHPAKAKDPIELHHLEKNIRFTSWVRNAYMQKKFGNSEILKKAEKDLKMYADRLPSLDEVNSLFKLRNWNRKPKGSENSLQLRLIQEYENGSGTKCESWGLEELLESIGCCIHGMNEFNLYCERNFVYEFFTSDYANALHKHLLQVSRSIATKEGKSTVTILEIGAGTGKLTNYLNSIRVKNDPALKFVATDTGTWAAKHKYKRVNGVSVEKYDYKTALEKFQPDIVLCSWMPLGEDWTQEIRNTQSVKEYILIGEIDDGCCGHPWRTWGHVNATNNMYKFAKNKGNDSVNDGKSVDIFHWMGRSKEAKQYEQSPTTQTAPLYAKDGFSRVELPISHLQLSRYDRQHYAANSHTIRFTRREKK